MYRVLHMEWSGSHGSPGAPCVALASGQAATTSTLEVLTQLPSTTIVPIWSVAAPTAAYRYLSLFPCNHAVLTVSPWSMLGRVAMSLKVQGVLFLRPF